MTDKSICLPVDEKVHELILGDSFQKGSSVAFHSIRYDFKPASVDTAQDAIVEVGENHQVTVALPHVQGSGTSHTVYKGNKRPCQKECVLIIDHETGTFTLEKLSNNIQLKKTRIEGSSKAGRPVTPVEQGKSKPSPSKKKSSVPVPSPGPRESPTNTEIEKEPPVAPPTPAPTVASPTPAPTVAPTPNSADVGVMSDSSSGEASSSGSDSSDSELENTSTAKDTSGQANGDSGNSKTRKTPSKSSAPKFMSTLCQDLQLSDSGSDSD